MRQAMALLREVDDDLDVAAPVLERFAPAGKRNAARDQAIEPGLVGLRQCLRRGLVVAAIGIDRAEYDVVVEHHLAIAKPDVEVHHTACGDAEKADDPSRRGAAE